MDLFFHQYPQSGGQGWQAFAADPNTLAGIKTLFTGLKLPGSSQVTFRWDLHNICTSGLADCLSGVAGDMPCFSTTSCCVSSGLLCESNSLGDLPYLLDLLLVHLL